MATKKPVPKKAAKKVVKAVAKKPTPAKKKQTKPVKKSVVNKKSKVKKSVPVKKVAFAKAKNKPKPIVKKSPAKKVAAKPKKIINKANSSKKEKSYMKTPKKAVTAKQAAKPKKPASKNNKSEKTKKEIGKNNNTPIGRPAPKKVEQLKEIKVPKTSVKTSVPYKPDYKPLDQRNEGAKNSEPLVRYNDNDLNEFRELINKKYDAAKKELSYLQGLITRKDEMGGDEAESRYMTMEDGSMSMEREQLSQMASRQITYIDHLEKALIRIENKTYGICRVTGKLIDKARLRAVPHATLSLEAKLGIVKAE